uniref:Uncharacterized protein n=1 Tax=Tanacetum cinerariifolium TaxID=118510 RepID=A0A6L2KSM3_TANCI|nr:hypothetical protein [Tanacetum cinerariifolium]
MQSRESKVVSSKALDASLVVIECSGTRSGEHITSSSSGTYITHVVDADIRLVNDQVPSVEVDSNTTPDSTNTSHRGGEIDQDAKQDQVKSPLLKAENSQEESYGSNDMAHNHYLEEARKKTQERNMNSKPSVIPSIRLQNTANGRKLFDSCKSKVDSEPPNGSNDDITNPYECDQTLNVSADPVAVAASIAVDPASSPSSTTIDEGQTLPVSKLGCVLCHDAVAFCLRRLPAFCLKVTAFYFKTKLRFASRPSTFCSRTHCDLSQEGCVLSPRQLRFDLTAF